MVEMAISYAKIEGAALVGPPYLISIVPEMIVLVHFIPIYLLQCHTSCSAKLAPRGCQVPLLLDYSSKIR